MKPAPFRPRITLRSTSYNHERFVVDALDSVARGNLRPMQWIIVDDASSDKSPLLIERWLGANADLLARHQVEVEFIRHDQNRGFVPTLNEILDRAKGDILCALSLDDRMLPGRIDQCCEAWSDLDHDYACTFSDAFTIGSDGQRYHSMYVANHRSFKKVPDGDIFDELADGNFICAGTATYRTEILRSAGGYHDTECEDYDLSLRLARDYKFKFLSSPLFEYRYHANNLYKRQDFHRACYWIFRKHLDRESALRRFVNNLYPLKKLKKLTPDIIADLKQLAVLRRPRWRRTRVEILGTANPLLILSLDRLYPALIHAAYAALGHPLWLRQKLGSIPGRWLLERRNLPGIGSFDCTAPDLRCDPFVCGWSEPEAHGRWTDGPEAVLGIRIAQPHPRVLHVSLQLLPFVPSGELIVEVWTGRWQFVLWRFTAEQQYWQSRTFSVDCPADCAGEAIEIAFVIRSPQSPADLGLSDDRRRLGLLVRSARVGYPMRPDAFDRPLDFRDGSLDVELLWSGWWPPEPTGTWTNGEKAVLGLRLGSRPDRDIAVAISLQQVLMEPPIEPITVSAGGTPLATVLPDSKEIHFIVPRDAVDPDGSLAIAFDIPRPVVPAVRGLSTDTRALGLHLTKMTLS